MDDCILVPSLDSPLIYNKRTNTGKHKEPGENI